MEENFNDILMAMLDGYENGMAADEVIAAAVEKAQLSDEDKSYVEESVSVMEAYEDKAHALAAAREDGMTRREWVEQELDNSLHGVSDADKATFANGVAESMEQSVNMLTKE